MATKTEAIIEGIVMPDPLILSEDRMVNVTRELKDKKPFVYMGFQLLGTVGYVLLDEELLAKLNEQMAAAKARMVG